MAALYIEENGNGQLYYAFTDHLGSLTALTNQADSVVERYAFNPWGVRRDPSAWNQQDNRDSWLTNRGFTLHEHLDEFAIINMNGRVYDPILAQFLSPDPQLQAPGNWLNYNRYGYCLNNPLIYVDPDGEWFWLIPVAIAGTINVIDNWTTIQAAWDENGWKGVGKGLGYFAVGGGKAAATYFGGPLGMIASSYIGDMTNSLLTDGTLNNFDVGVTTQGLFVNLAVGQLGLGNTVGNAVTKNIGNEFLKNATKQVIGQNIDGLILSVGQRTWQYGLEDGLKVAWGDYTKRGGWAKSTVSGLGQGAMDTYDFRTIARNENQEAMKEYHSKNKSLRGFEYTLQPDTWMESFYHSQMKYNMQLNLNVYKPSRNFINYTLPRWYYPSLRYDYFGK